MNKEYHDVLTKLNGGQQYNLEYCIRMKNAMKIVFESCRIKNEEEVEAEREEIISKFSKTLKKLNP